MLTEVENTIEAQSLPFGDLTEHDGAWYGMLTHSGGTIYACPCGHGGTAHLFEYVPETGELTDLAELAAVTHEGHLGRMRQGKIHSQPVEDADGTVYLATYYGNTQEWDYDGPESYPGGHWIQYDPRARVCRDLGIARPHEGIHHWCIDRERRYLYGATVPGLHFIRYNLSTGEHTDFGRATMGTTIICDRRGRVYIPRGEGSIVRYDPNAESLEELSLRLPPAGHAGAIDPIWRHAQFDSSGRMLYAFGLSTGIISRFDTEDGEEGSIEPIGLWASDEGAQNCEKMGGTNFWPDPGFCLVDDRMLFGTSPASDGAHFVTFDLERRERKDHGLITFEGGLRPLYCGAFTVGLDHASMYAIAIVYEYVQRQLPLAERTLGKYPHVLRFLKWHYDREA